MEGRGLQSVRGPRAEAAALEAGGVLQVGHEVLGPTIVGRQRVVEVARRQRYELVVEANDAGEACNVDGRVLLVMGVAGACREGQLVVDVVGALAKDRPIACG